MKESRKQALTQKYEKETEDGRICPEYSPLQQRHLYLCTITHESAMGYLDMCQVGSAFVMVMFV